MAASILGKVHITYLLDVRKRGHYRNNCKIEVKINSLNLDEGLNYKSILKMQEIKINVLTRE